MSARETDRQVKRRWVQQYVERQKAYLPTYTSDQRRATPPLKSLQSDGFGFDTPVLRPRVPVNKTPPKAGPSKSQVHEAESSDEAPPDTAPSKPRTKRKKAPTPTNTDDEPERAARLAGRRERKRKKRAIVNPPRKHDDDETMPTAPLKKGRTRSQKAKKPAALALLYGFSATNVTKDRLTLKPTPSLGVFSKGRASAKKKVTATTEFCESAFLNKRSERTAGHSKIDGDSDDRSVSSISNNPAAQAPRIANPTKKDRGKFGEATALKTPQASTRPTAGSEVWDIELQSKLPSSVRDVSSESGASESAPIILDPRAAMSSLRVAVEQDEHSHRTRTRGLSVVQQSEVARPNLYTELGITRIEDAPSIHPSHSASQVGHRVADIQQSEPRRVVGSKYFTEFNPISESVHEITAISQPTSRSNDGFGVHDCRLPDQDGQDDASRVPTRINSLISVAQPMLQFQTRYDGAPLASSSDGSPYDDCYARAGMPLEPPGDCGYVESCAVEQYVSILGYDVAQQGTYSAGLAGNDAEYYVSMEDIYDPSVPEYEKDLEGTDMYDPGEGWSCPQQDSTVYEDGALGEGMTAFLEGRALLLGVPEWPRNVGLSGLAQAEMDVANRLGDHWRRQRLS